MKRTLLSLVATLLFMGGIQSAEAQAQQNPQGNTTQTAIEQIDRELAQMAQAIDECDDWDVKNGLVTAFTKKLERYLSDPQTYHNDMPLLKKQMGISKLPISGDKLYRFGWYEGGTQGLTYYTYIQYCNENGEVGYVPFLNDLRYKSFFDFHEFRYNNTIYYLVEKCFQGSTASWRYYISVVSIKDGVITYHPEFLPVEPEFQPSKEEYFIYDENGEIIDQAERPCYFLYVCGTDTANNNVGLTFDAETLTIHVKDDADLTESRTGAVTISEWKLRLPGNE